MKEPEGRIEREWRTVRYMIGMHCRDRHGAADATDDLCSECAKLAEYARYRLDACRYGAGKPVCARCPTHCYRPEMRERIRQVMRHSGPRMLLAHPGMAIRHLIDRLTGPRLPG